MCCVFAVSTLESEENESKVRSVFVEARYTPMLACACISYASCGVVYLHPTHVLKSLLMIIVLTGSLYQWESSLNLLTTGTSESWA